MCILLFKKPKSAIILVVGCAVQLPFVWSLAPIIDFLVCTGQPADSRVTEGSISIALGILFTIILVPILIACVHKCKRQKFNFSTNVAYHRRHAQDETSQSNNYCEVVTDQNIAYESSQALEVSMLNTECNEARGKRNTMLGRLIESDTCRSITSLPVPDTVSSESRLQEDKTSNFEYDYIA